jgi:hypothetical protein
VRHLFGGVVAAILLPCAALADGQAQFCLNKVGSGTTQAEVQSVPSPSDRAGLQRIEQALDKAHTLFSEGRDVMVLQAAGGSRLSQAKLPQPSGGHVAAIVSLDPNWIWVGGVSRDYLVPLLRTRGSVSLGAPRAVSHLTSGPCNWFAKLTQSSNCTLAKSYHSAATNRLFVTGYRPARFATDARESVEIVGGSLRPLDQVLDLDSHVVELSASRMSIFRDRDGEIIAAGALGLRRVTPPAGSEASRWVTQVVQPSERVFFQERTTDAKPGRQFELRRDGDIRLLQQSLAVGWQRLFDFPPIGHVVGISRSALDVELNGRWVRLAAVGPGAHIHGPADIRYSAGSVYFKIAGTRYVTAEQWYSLTPRKSDAACEQRLGVDGALVLQLRQ